MCGLKSGFKRPYTNPKKVKETKGKRKMALRPKREY
jgi:hypothetical protein